MSIHRTQDCSCATPNDGAIVPTFTLRYRAVPNEVVVGDVEAVARRCGASVTWQRNGELFPTYALVEGASNECAVELESADAVVVAGALMALAVSPHVAEALPFLEQALCGDGAPGVLRLCERVGTALVVEWDVDRSAARTVTALIDLELARLRCGRTTRLLSPLPLHVWTGIAADGLAASEIAPDRVLEALLERYGVID